LDNVAEYILELDRGEGFPFKGNYSGFLEKKMARLELDAKIDNKRKNSLKRELEVRDNGGVGGTRWGIIDAAAVSLVQHERHNTFTQRFSLRVALERS